MNLNQLLKEKLKYSEIIKKEYFFPKENKENCLVMINNKNLLEDLIDGFKNLPVNFIIISDLQIENSKNILLNNDLNKKNLLGIDFIICDNEIIGLSEYLKLGIVPIISKKSHLSSLMKEFDPIKNIGNSFLYEAENKWSLFYAIVRYLENSKFSYDNRNLIGNVLEI